MGSSRIKTQGQNQGHATSTFMWGFFFREDQYTCKNQQKKNINITKQHKLLHLVYRCVYISQ